MKDLNRHLLICFVLLLVSNTACSESPNKALTWDNGGNVSNASNEKIKVDLQNVYDGLNYRGGVYLLGYKIDSKGINYPSVAWVPHNLKNPGYWSFDEDLQDLFIYKNVVHLLDRKGETYTLGGNSWTKTSMKMQPNSVVVYSSDTGGDVIACYPSPARMITPGIGACYSVNRHWKQEINWIKVTPKVCNGYLIAVDNQKDRKVMKKISIDKGQILASKIVSEEIKDLCSINI